MCWGQSELIYSVWQSFCNDFEGKKKNRVCLNIRITLFELQTAVQGSSWSTLILVWVSMRTYDAMSYMLYVLCQPLCDERKYFSSSCHWFFSSCRQNFLCLYSISFYMLHTLPALMFTFDLVSQLAALMLRVVDYRWRGRRPKAVLFHLAPVTLLSS